MKWVTLLSASLLLAACADTTNTSEEETPTSETEQVDESSETESQETNQEEASEESTEENTEDQQTDDQAADEDQDETGEQGSVLKFGYGAPHGTKSFAVTFVGLEDDTITHAFIDEFQFMGEGDWDPVPNDDGEFGDYYDEEATLVSKVENDEAYSANMADKAGATMTLAEGYQAISDFAVGKTVDELNEAIEELNNLDDDQEISDVVTGATLVDTAGYLQDIVDVAENGFSYEAADSIEGAEFNYTLAAPHGDKAFALVATLTDGDTILAAVQDEFQFMEGDNWDGVPNSDDEFGEYYEDGRVLISKFENDQDYSANMTDNAGAENTYVENMDAILAFAQGKTIDEIKEAISELENQDDQDEIADVVSGATFVDTNGYLQAIVDTVEN